jgi:hypothetical protein
VMTGLAIKLLKSWGIPVANIRRFIRGDDSAIYVDNWATGAAMNLAYEAIGAKAGEGKFSLQHRQMEFLRVWFDDRCRGYPARAIPSLTQRKPWSSPPWTEDMVLRAIHETVRTLRRRVDGRRREIDLLWRTMRHVWCQNHSLPDAVCWTPVVSGGLGIEPQPIGQSWHVTPPLPRADPSVLIRPLNQTSWRADTMREYAQERYSLQLGVAADSLAARELTSTLTADNIPAIAQRVRQDWLSQVRHAGCKATRTFTRIIPFKTPVPINTYDGDSISLLLSRLRGLSPMFGRCPEIATARADYSKFRPPYSFTKWLQRHFPRAYDFSRRFHKSWHLSEKLDYLSGDLCLAPAKLHPALVGILSLTLASVMRPSKKACRNISLWAGGLLEREVCESRLSRRTYMW